MKEIMESLSSYLIAFGAMVVSTFNHISYDSVLSWGGIALLIIKVLADAPRAWRNIKRWIGRD